MLSRDSTFSIAAFRSMHLLTLSRSTKPSVLANRRLNPITPMVLPVSAAKAAAQEVSFKRRPQIPLQISIERNAHHVQRAFHDNHEALLTSPCINLPKLYLRGDLYIAEGDDYLPSRLKASFGAWPSNS